MTITPLYLVMQARKALAILCILLLAPDLELDCRK